MKIHEYQAKELFAERGIPIPEQVLATTPEEARAAALSLGGKCVVKAQVHAGGRGKAGGVKLAKTPDEAAAAAEGMLGKPLITKQSGPLGSIVRKVLVTACADIAKEYYVSITMDMENACPVIIASAAGGMEIEELAKTDPGAIARIPVSPETGFRAYHGFEAARALGVPEANKKELCGILGKLYGLFVEKDCSLVEINPLVLTAEGSLTALDAKVNFDDNGLMRHPDLSDLRDPSEESPEETEAREHDLSYVSLSGDTGCLVNGAGLAMATMDMIKSLGGDPANFLDVGGSASVEKVTAAFRILLSSSRVHAILVNIFGGIMKCDVIAEGVVAAAKAVSLSVPLVVRLQGTNSEAGKNIIAASGLTIIPANDFHEAVEKAVAAAKGACAE